MSGLTDFPDVHIALDAEDEPTLWWRRPLNPHGDKALARRCEMDGLAWSLIVAAVEEIESEKAFLPMPAGANR